MGGPRAQLAALVALAACAAPASSSTADELQFVASAVRGGRIDEAMERVAALRLRDPRSVEVLEWSAWLGEATWRDDDALSAWRVVQANAPQPELRQRAAGRIGDLLFRLGRYAECPAVLRDGAVVEDGERRRAFAALTAWLPGQRTPEGPLLVEQALPPGAMPELVCSSMATSRPFAIDTGTSMTTLARSFAAELAVLGLQPAGRALDGVGRSMAIEAGVLPAFVLGGIGVGAVPVLVVDDTAMQLRDLHGGVDRVPRGVLGLDLLATCRLTLDPERGSVVLELPRSLPLDESVACVRVDGRCLVPLFVEDARMWFVLDTGASHSSLTEAGLLRLAGGAERATPSAHRVRTVGGAVVSVREVRDLVLRCSAVRFLGVDLPVVARADSGPFPVHGVLGVDLLRRCRMTLDRGRLRLQAVR
ncbi:MAG: aspartyl protease family protein [Planctomycetes bacterium]|nr:aspartyl protease family protein [Planctomycetota bacterium]